jgi:hypothetical protein
MLPEECEHRISIASGETVTPCHKPKGHSGDHEGYCLGSRATWGNGPDEVLTSPQK